MGNNEKVEIDNPAAATWYIMLRAYSAYSGVTLVATYGPAGNNFASDPNCVALWRFEQTPSGNLDPNDSIGTNTLVNHNDVAPTALDFTEGLSAANFERDDSAFLSIADANLDPGFPLKSGKSNKRISVCLWFKPESVVSQYLFAKIHHPSDYSFGLIVTNIGSVYRLALRVGSGSGSPMYQYVHGGTEFLTDRWYHIAATYDDTNRSFRLRVYDENASSATESTGTTIYHIATTSADVTIGAMSTPSFFADGLFDEVAVFNDILTPDEIDQIREGTYGKP